MRVRVDEKLDRSDIRSDPSDGAVRTNTKGYTANVDEALDLT